MSRIKSIKAIGSTLTVAVAIGFIVQYGEAGPDVPVGDSGRISSEAPRTLMMATNNQGQAVFGVPDVVTAPHDHVENLRQVVAVDAVYTEFDAPQLGTILATPVSDCNTQITAKRKIAAMVELTVAAPCHESADFVVQHEGLMFSGITDRGGNAVVMVPALVTDAAFALTFANVLQATTDIFVPELRQYDRAVLQWKTRDNMRLHALERGAAIGESGHVWSASIHSAEDTRARQHGFVVYLGNFAGDIPYQAEVYTFPEGLFNRDGDVILQVGVSVSDKNCNREVEATTIQTNAGEMLVNSTFAVKMPTCDQVGNVVLFNDKFTDLTVASR